MNSSKRCWALKIFGGFLVLLQPARRPFALISNPHGFTDTHGVLVSRYHQSCGLSGVDCLQSRRSSVSSLVQD